MLRAWRCQGGTAPCIWPGVSPYILERRLQQKPISQNLATRAYFIPPSPSLKLAPCVARSKIWHYSCRLTRSRRLLRTKTRQFSGANAAYCASPAGSNRLTREYIASLSAVLVGIRTIILARSINDPGNDRKRTPDRPKEDAAPRGAGPEMLSPASSDLDFGAVTAELTIDVN